MQVCHELLGKAWGHAQSYVHSGFGIPSEELMLRMLRHTCEHQVWQHSLQKHSAASHLRSGYCMCSTKFSKTIDRLLMLHVHSSRAVSMCCITILWLCLSQEQTCCAGG